MWTTTTQNKVWLTTKIGVVALDRVESISTRSRPSGDVGGVLYDVVAYISGSSKYYPMGCGFKTEDEALEKIEEIMKSMAQA
jgi:hypothetical protein